MLTVMHGHFFIDLITGLVMGRIIFKLGEKMSYFFDVKPLGLPCHKRENYFYKPCPKCGWCNEFADRLIYPSELAF